MMAKSSGLAGAALLLNCAVFLLDELCAAIYNCFVWCYNIACRFRGEKGLWGPAERGDVSRVRALLEQVRSDRKGASQGDIDVNAMDSLGFTALHYARFESMPMT